MHLVLRPFRIRGRQLQVEHESDYRPPVKGLVELREYDSYPGFLEISCCPCNHFFTLSSQGQRLSDKLGVRLLCEGVYIPTSP